MLKRSSEMDLPSEKDIESEKILHERFIKKYNNENIDTETVQHFFENFSLYPQNIFFFTIDKVVFVGRKTLSKYYLERNLLEAHCTEIDPHMILGKLLDEHISEKGVHLYYKNITRDEKRYIIAKFKINNNINISHKYVYFYKNKRAEISSPIDGWKLNPIWSENLSKGENIIRSFTNNIFLKDFDLNDKVIYDPACSTGKFLSEIKKNYPKCYTIGQDLSKSMVEFAKDKVDEVHCLDAKFSPRNGRFADFIFVRFLNSEVVTRENAKRLYKNIIKRVNKGGYIIVLGHTPILLSLYDMEVNGYKVIRTNAYLPQSQSVFQYYVIKWHSSHKPSKCPTKCLGSDLKF